MAERPLILVTSDDGIDSGGLTAAAEAVRTIGEVLVVAPETQQTGMGRSFPRYQGQGVIERIRRPLGGQEVGFYAVRGSPAQAVAHAVLEIAPRLPALCICGINDGENLGGTNLVSGTVGAALEAASLAIPALAVSRGPEDPELFARPYREADWEVASETIRRFAWALLREGLPPEVAFLSVNIPASATRETPCRLTRQSRQSHYVCARPGPRDFSKPFRLPVTAILDLASLEADSDLHAFYVDRVISVTPMGCDLSTYGIDCPALNLALGGLSGGGSW